MNIGEAYDQLIVDIGTAANTKVITEGGWDPPCVVIGAGGWIKRGVSFYPAFLVDVVLDAEVTENYALSLIEQQKMVIEALAGRSYVFDIRPEAPVIRMWRGREWIVGRINVGLIYDD